MPLNQPIIAFFFFQTDAHSNGGVKSIVEVIRNLRNFKAIVFTNKTSHFTLLLEASGVQVVLVRWPKKKFLWVGIKPFFLFQSLQLLRNSRASLIHFNDIQTLSLHGLAAHLLSIPFIMNIRGVKIPEATYGWSWWLCNFAQSIIVLSKQMQTELSNRLPLIRKEYWQKQLIPIYSIIDFKQFHPDPSLNLEAKWYRQAVLFAAAFNDLKNQFDFIEQALPALAKHQIRVHFVGDADNSYAQKCKLKVQELGLEKFAIFHGFQAQMQDWYNWATITVIPTRREGLARCMIESMACGTPVVSFDVPSAQEILLNNGSRAGFIEKQADYEALVERVLSVFTDFKTYTSMCHSALEIARHLFAKDEIIKKYEKVYLAALKNE